MIQVREDAGDCVEEQTAELAQNARIIWVDANEEADCCSDQEIEDSNKGHYLHY